MLEDVIRQDFPEKISAFSSNFVKARQVFNESLHVEILKGVDSLGERYEHNHSRPGKLTWGSFFRTSEGIRQARERIRESREIEASPESALLVW